MAEQGGQVRLASNAGTNSRRRNRREIFYDIIRAADGGARKTAIMYRSCLNPVRLNSHLELLVSEGFVERDAGSALIRATQKGRRYVKAFERYAQTKLSLSEQERALREFWHNGDEREMKVAPDGDYERRKIGLS